MRLIVLLTALGALTAGCGTIDRIGDIGQEPPLTPVEDPTLSRDYKPVSLPMLPPATDSYAPNSLWRQNARAFFRDQRAAKIGDILTVEINIADRAELSNETARTRSSSEDANLAAFLGLESGLTRFLPQAVSPGNLTNFGSNSGSTGNGSIDREETVELTVAALITQILPNGNLVIMGRQEVRVNYEVRELQITGIVRPQDISNSNTVQHDQIAEARIAYGGRGHITELQKPRYGQELYEILFPF